MKQDGEHVASRERAFAPIAAICAAIAGIIMMGLPTRQAQALPSFARQTGQPCGTCHTDYPALTPFGRRFKLLGYTVGGGPYRTTPFSSNAARDVQAEYNRLLGYAETVKAPPPVDDNSKTWVPPISAMAIVGFTHTQADQPSPQDPLNPNNNTVYSPFSMFWGGAITSNIGAFAQVTYNNPGSVAAPTPTTSPFVHTWTWDNTDVRFAGTANIGWLDFVYGITANNNPSVQDLWNTTPAWSFPYA